MEHFKFISFLKSGTEKVLARWQSEMDAYVTAVRKESPGKDILEIKFQWLFTKMAEVEGASINAEIAKDWKQQNL